MFKKKTQPNPTKNGHHRADGYAVKKNAEYWDANNLQRTAAHIQIYNQRLTGRRAQRRTAQRDDGFRRSATRTMVSALPRGVSGWMLLCVFCRWPRILYILKNFFVGNRVVDLHTKCAVDTNISFCALLYFLLSLLLVMAKSVWPVQLPLVYGRSFWWLFFERSKFKLNTTGANEAISCCVIVLS